ncbi:MAG: pantoate--beta-alanine ligase [Balneolaceae bacterium]|nr:pantoate--beta-alanine ligase [Balneolaceae bacterium]
MEAIKLIDEIREQVNVLKQQGKTVGFVPTMGALHDGHLSLIRLALEKVDAVVVSIYVNPEQFGPDEDFDEYPRQLSSDLEICEDEGVDLVFAPSDQMMYPEEKQYIRIEVDELKDHMDGASRPGFYEGIMLVVNKLFNIIEPDVAVFGQKDIQQVRILQRMVKEMNHGIELVMGPIRRANDGLALSSRNAYLNDEERLKAPALFRSLIYVKKQIEDGVDTPKLLLEHQVSELEAKGFKIDYFNVFTFADMKPAEKLTSGNKYIIAGAVYLGDTRLIDNLIIEF